MVTTYMSEWLAGQPTNYRLLIYIQTKKRIITDLELQRTPEAINVSLIHLFLYFGIQQSMYGCIQSNSNQQGGLHNEQCKHATHLYPMTQEG